MINNLSVKYRSKKNLFNFSFEYELSLRGMVWICALGVIILWLFLEVSV
jgi:hypothetical protein